MPQVPFHQIDVFSALPYAGNGVAVLSLPSAPSAEQMQRIARWTQLSETVFLLPPPAAAQGEQEQGERADFAVRIWMPQGELPFAGHPTLGAARAYLELHPQFAGNELRMHCGIGIVRLRIDRSSKDGVMLFFAAPPLRNAAPVDPATIARVCEAMSIDPTSVLEAQHIDNGPPWFALRLASADAVRRVETKEIGRAGGAMWGVFAQEKGEWLVRTFAPQSGVVEDPVTGSFTAGLARSPLAPKGDFVVRQGENLGREGRIFVKREGEVSWIGGRTSVCFWGEARVEMEDE